MGLTNPIHIAFVLVLLLLVFGAKRLPEIGRSLGSGMRGFRDSLTGESEQQVATAKELEPPVAAREASAEPSHSSPVSTPSARV
jgi:sec-independent protein translocase protein TatA